MKRILLLALGLATVGCVNQNADNSEIAAKRAQHGKHLDSSPFKDIKHLPKTERKAMGLPPTRYNERMWELTMNPELGRPTPENLDNIKRTILEDRLAELGSGRVPGDASDNSWVERGPNNVGGRVRAVMFDPNDATNETVFAGGVSGGLWKNTNISSVGSQWTRVNIPDNLNVSCITVDPNDSNTFYLGTGESYVAGDVNGNGVWKSTDGGDSWTNIFGGTTGQTAFVSGADMTVNSPAGIAGNYFVAPTSAFGTPIFGPITGNVVLVDDGTGNPTEGCNALSNGGQINGNIALIRRGSCAFTQKVKNAQDAGAIAAIVMNNSGTPFSMGGADATVTIPSIMISETDGDLLEAELSSNPVNVTINVPTDNFAGMLVPGIHHINDIKVRNNNGTSELYVAAGDTFYADASTATYFAGPELGLYKSSDGGTTWNEINLPLTTAGNKHTPNDIEIGADNTVWVSTTNSRSYGDGGGQIFKSTDANATSYSLKHSVTNGVRVQIAVSSSDPNKIYVLAQGGGADPVIMERTINGFVTANSMALPNDADTGIAANDFTRGQAFYDLMLEVDPSNDNTVYTGGIDLFKSTNSGGSWNQFSHWYGGFGEQEVHADQHALAFAPGNSNRLAFGNDGGIYFSNNGGTNTNARNNGLNITQFYTLGVAPTTVGSGGDYFAAGSQDNGTQAFVNVGAGVNGSIEHQGGDGAGTDYDQGGDAYYVSNYVYNNRIMKRNIGGGGEITINNDSNSFGDFINQQDLDYNQDILYTNYTDNATGTYRIRRYASFLNSNWLNPVQKTELTNALLNRAPIAFKVSPYTTGSTKLFVGTELGSVLVLNNADGTPTWSDITGTNFVGSVSDIEFGQNENEIFVTMHNYGVTNIWYTTNGGTTWVSKEGDLPDMPVKAILQNPLNTEEVIIGTELGVWYTQDFSSASPSWYSAFNGMSNVKVTDLDLRDDNTVYAATYGRGVFSGQFTADTFSVNEEELENSVSVYPTVTDGVVNIASAESQILKLNVFNLSGQVVLSKDVELNNNSNQINLKRYASGVYLLNFSQGNVKFTKKVILK